MPTQRPTRYVPTLTEVVDPAPKAAQLSNENEIERLIQSQVSAQIDALLPEFRRQVEAAVRAAVQQQLLQKDPSRR